MVFLRRVASGVLALLCLGCRHYGDLPDAEKKAKMKVMFEDYHARFDGVKALSAGELLAWRDSGRPHVLLDARSEEEQAVSRIPGAVLEKDFSPGDAGDAPIVVYCTIGYRSGKHAQSLVEQGHEALNLEGGILAWTHAGKPLVTPGGEETRRVHVYGARWDLAAEGYESVY